MIALGISLNDLTFFMGSLIYPKEMLKNYTDNQAQATEVMKVYWFLYKFSLEKLQNFIRKPFLMLVLSKYLSLN